MECVKEKSVMAEASISERKALKMLEQILRKKLKELN